MGKKIDVSKTVFELTNEYPEIKDIMVKLGFTEIVKEELRNSMGKIMTIPKGAMVKGIPMIDIIAEFMANGFEIAGEMPAHLKEVKEGGESEVHEKPKTRTE